MFGFFRVPRLRCFMPYQKLCVLISPNNSFSFFRLKRSLLSLPPFSPSFPDISGFDGVEKRRRGGKQQFCVSGGGPPSFSPSGSPAAIVRVFLPPLFAKKAEAKEIGGRKLHCSGIRRGLLCFPFFSSDSPLSPFLSFPCPFFLFLSLCPPFFLHFFC